MAESTDYPEGMPDVDLLTYVRGSARDSTSIDEAKTTAAQMVADKIGAAVVPQSVLSAAILAVGSNLAQRRVSSAGTSNYGDPETMGNPMRPALDPFTPAWPILRPYLGPGLA